MGRALPSAWWAEDGPSGQGSTVCVPQAQASLRGWTTSPLSAGGAEGQDQAIPPAAAA